MSADSTPESQRATLERLVEEKPLSHPLPFTIRHRDVFGHDQHVPPHLQRIDNEVYHAFDDHYPTAPKTLGYIYPRGHGKSETGSGVDPVWKALEDPNVRILIMMLNTEEAKGKLAKCKGYLEQLAPLYGLSIEESNKTRLTLKRDADHAEPTIRAAGFDSGVTGGRYEYIIFDDIVDASDQKTKHRRDGIEAKFEDHLNLRADDNTVFVTLATRKHPKDIYSNLIGSAGWRTTVEKAIGDWSIVENNEYDLITTSELDGKKRRYPASKANLINPEAETIIAAEPYRWCKVLWPERRPLNNLLVDLHQGFGQTSGSRVWRREMQNNAKPLQGTVLSEDMLAWVPSLPGRESEYVRFAGLDLGVEKDPEKAMSNDTDYWALSILAHSVTTRQTYLEDVYHDRGMSMEGAINWLSGIVQGHDRLTTILTEKNQAQDFFIQRAENVGLPVERSNSFGAKEDRIIALSAMFESGMVKIVGSPNSLKRTDAMDDWVDEWTAFPGHDHDDLPDSTEIGLRWLSSDSSTKETRVYDIGH